MSTEPKTDEVDPSVAQKKPYHAPKLEVHGTIREVTGHVGVSGASDPPPLSPTHFRTH